MNSISISTEPEPAVASPLVLPMPQAHLKAGFPSPAEDFTVNRLDLTQILVSHPQATFLMRVSGTSMQDAGIDDGDMLVIDRAIRAKSGHVVIARIDAEYTCKVLHLRNGQMRLKAANPTFPDIIPKDGQTIEVWGVVSSCIKRFIT